MKFSVKVSSRHLVYFSGTTMEIRVTRPFIVYFIPGDQYGGPDCFISCLHVLFTEINQIKSNSFYGPTAYIKYTFYSRIRIHVGGVAICSSHRLSRSWSCGYQSPLCGDAFPDITLYSVCLSGSWTISTPTSILIQIYFSTVLNVFNPSFTFSLDISSVITISRGGSRGGGGGCHRGHVISLQFISDLFQMYKI